MGFGATLTDDQSELQMVIEGRFDFKLHSDFRDAYRDLPARTRFVIDLGKTTFMDSSAMGMLLLLREHAGETQADIRLRNCSPEVLRVLKMSNLDKIFTIE